MTKKILEHSKTTSVYTYAGCYEEYLKSLPDNISELGLLLCGQVTHPSMFYTEVSKYLENKYYGQFKSYQSHRFKNEDELFITSTALIGEIFRLDSRGLVEGKDVTKRVTVSCRAISVLFSAVLKAKGIPCRSRAGFVDFGNEGESYIEHWVNEYWLESEKRWVLVDADGYYEFEERFGYSQFDLPIHKFVTAADAWLGFRNENFSKHLIVGAPTVLEGVCNYLFMDFHALMNNEVFYIFQPEYSYGRFNELNKKELADIDALALLLQTPDQNFDELLHIWKTNEKFYRLTNYGQNVYKSIFGSGH